MTTHIHTEPLDADAFLIVTETSTVLGRRAVVQALGGGASPHRVSLSPARAHRIGTALVAWAETVAREAVEARGGTR